MSIQQSFIYDLNTNLQRVFPAKYYRFSTEELNKFTITVPKAKLVMDSDYFTFIVNFEDEENKISYSGRRRDPYLTYDFDIIKSFYEKNKL